MFRPEQTVGEIGMALAAVVDQREAKAISKAAYASIFAWKPLDATVFSRGIAVPRMSYDLRTKIISDAIFEIEGDELKVMASDTTPIVEDPFAKPFLTEFYLVYEAHSHMLCLSGLRQQLLWKKEVEYRRNLE